jgi:transcription initiation factor TFIIB
MQNLESIKCSTCGRIRTAITDPESGEMICSNCGTVFVERYDEGITNPESHAFTIEEQDAEERTRTRTRIGASTSLSRHDKGLATVIGKPTKYAAGKKLDINTRSAFKRLKTLDTRVQMNSSTVKNLSKAFSELNTLKDKLGLSDVMVESTAYIYRKAEDRGLTRGRTISGMLTAALYLACRETGTPRTIKDIVRVSNSKRKDLAKNVRILTVELGIKTYVFDPMKCIARVANTLKIGERTRRRAFNMMKEVLRRKIISAGKDPMGLAASILYIACKETGEVKTQKDMANAADVTEVTIRNRVKDLEKNLNLLAVTDKERDNKHL